MKIKTRLSVQFTLIVAGILIFFSVLVYYFSYSSQLDKFRASLFENAKQTAVLLINVADVDTSLLKKIHQSTVSVEKEEIVLTDSAFNIIYSNNNQYLSMKAMRVNAPKDRINYFSLAGMDAVCYRHNFNNQNYYVYVTGHDRSRSDNLSELRVILFWSILFSVLLSVLLSYLFSQKAIKPISRIVNSVKEINSLKLNSRLNEGKGKDELEQLAITFNELLTNLEIAFRNQEEFVLNASHELRTPLTIMIGETDYILSRDRKKDEYVTHLSGLVSDLRKMNALINSLLELAQINRNMNIAYSDIRIDEVVFDAIQQIQSKYTNQRIIPKILYPEQGADLLVNGNYGLLEIVFQNLIDNACKFSNEDVGLEFVISDTQIRIIIADKGIGIPHDELNAIYKPFRRGSNVKFIGGFGIGLSLVNKIMSLHNAEMFISSRENEGTTTELVFNRTS
jgi:signal transduction histidine kinase